MKEIPNILILCACGCGQLTEIHSGNTSQYISGHNSKVKHPLFKKGHTEKSRKKMSDSHIGQIPWNKGKKGVYSEDALRKMSEKQIGIPAWNRGIKGENDHRWKGGISFEPYCPKFNNQLKESIRERDNRTCQLCGVKENGKKLAVHHIEYDKPNCNPDLIALCNSCNSKVNQNRNYYERLFLQKLNERGL